NFGATMIAPMNAGTYNFQWQGYETSDSMTFGSLTTNVAVVCTKNADAARYISKTGPVTIGAGTDFYVQNTMMNLGTKTWSTSGGYSMMTVTPNNDPKWVSTRMYLPGVTTVAPGAQGTFTTQCTAPSTPGTYSMQWRMNKNGTSFGDLSPLLNITVTASADD